MSILHDVVNGGLYSTDREPYFSYRGCDVNLHPDCQGGLGCDVEDASGYASLDDARNHPENIYEFCICAQCNYLAQYGE